MNTDCTVRRKAVTISLGEYVAAYRDEQKFMEYCRQCPNYARLWSCPPFDDCKDRIFRDYSQITIFASIITPDSSDIPLAQSSEIIIPERRRLERILLEMEYRYTGYAFAYAGSCLNCPQGTCTRPSGGRCRHPQLARSLRLRHWQNHHHIARDRLMLEYWRPHPSLSDSSHSHHA